MDPSLAFLTNPIIIALIAIGVFTGRVVILARRLKSASRSPTLADTRALEEAQKALDSHRASLQAARDTVAQNLGGARDTLREYKAPLNTSIETRRRVIESSVKTRERQKEAFDEVKGQKAFRDAKRLIHDAVPRSRRHAPKDI